MVLIATFDVEGLVDVLAEGLPRLDIPSAYLSLYEDPESPAEWSRLMLSYDENGRAELETEGRRFPSSQLAPEGTLPQERQYSIVVEPLYFQEHQLGFVLFEAGSREGSVYEALRGQISNALHGASLVEQVENRAFLIQTAAEVSRAASSILDPAKLIQQVVELIRGRFDLYYAGLFLVDRTDVLADLVQWAYLQAGTGEAGRKMRKRKYKLQVGGDSMIGQCIASGESRIALGVGEEAARFSNPLLPDTRSELALPLISRGQAIGALTIQSSRDAAFTGEDIAIFETMASQLANTIENARLFKQTEEALKAAEADLRRYVKETWSRYLGRDR
jgi:putative methionine-R-sulfoxide reductase with GAF domain